MLACAYLGDPVVGVRITVTGYFMSIELLGDSATLKFVDRMQLS
jgi:hypothetical protein